jgi:hypothetical protein
MALFAQGARSRLAVAAESSFGVLPTTPSWADLPKRSHSLNLTKERVQGEDIRSDRMQIVDRHGNRSVTGSVEVDLRRGDYDLLLESTFFNTFDTNDHLTVGTTPQFLAFEDSALDIGQHRQFSGCLVNTATFNIAPNQMVQATFDIVGRNMVQASGSISGSPSAPTNFEPFDSFNGALLEGGVGTADGICIVSALQFNITNDVAPAHVILCEANKDQAAQMQFGMATVEGTMTVYYEDAALINKFINETETSLSVTVDDPTGANGYTFFMPRIKYNGANVPLANAQSRFIELPFVALKGGSSSPFNLRLTRTSGT